MAAAKCGEVPPANRKPGPVSTPANQRPAAGPDAVGAVGRCASPYTLFFALFFCWFSSSPPQYHPPYHTAAYSLLQLQTEKRNLFIYQISSPVQEPQWLSSSCRFLAGGCVYDLPPVQQLRVFQSIFNLTISVFLFRRSLTCFLYSTVCGERRNCPRVHSLEEEHLACPCCGP